MNINSSDNPFLHFWQNTIHSKGTLDKSAILSIVQKNLAVIQTVNGNYMECDFTKEGNIQQVPHDSSSVPVDERAADLRNFCKTVHTFVKNKFFNPEETENLKNTIAEVEESLNKHIVEGRPSEFITYFLNQISHELYEARIEPTTTSHHTVKVQSPPLRAAIALANTVPPLSPPKWVDKDIVDTHATDWKLVAMRSLTFFSSTALGVLTGLSMAGMMITPVGWAIAGGVLLIAIIGSVTHFAMQESEFGNSALRAGMRELISSLMIAGAGFTIGAAAGGAFSAGGIAWLSSHDMLVNWSGSFYWVSLGFLYFGFSESIGEEENREAAMRKKLRSPG